jgi:serine/threonine protein kinase
MSQPKQKSSFEIDDETLSSYDGDHQAGEILGGRYQVISRLGHGGMGVVYKVRQLFLDKEMALKTINKHCITETALRRFQQEAQTAFAIEHPNVIQVNDFGLLDDDTPFLVMELLQGETLGDLIKRKTRLSVDDAMAIFIQVSFGMAYAHELGVVHRDIKPSNIMTIDGVPYGTEGGVKIVDFGIAKYSAREGGEVQALTRTGEIFGSPLYMSPEQCLGGAVDQRSDVYSLGCVLFEALTGTPPFIGDNALSTMMKHQAETAPPLKEASLGIEFPKALETVVAKMLEKQPSKRYQNLGLVAHDLATIKNGGVLGTEAKQKRRLAPKREERKISIRNDQYITLLISVAFLSTLMSFFSVYLSTDQSAPVVPQRLKTRQILDQMITVPSDTEAFRETPENLKRQLALPGDKFMDRNKDISTECLEIIAGTKWITYLDLMGATIPNKKLSILAALPLNSIQLSLSNLNDEGALQTCSIKTLQFYFAGHTRLTDNSVCKLADLPLRELNLEFTQIADLSLNKLAKSKTLRTLKLTHCKNITSNGIAELQNSSSLSTLDLRHTSCQDASLIELKKLKTLEKIVLAETAVTPTGISSFCHNSNIKTVVISYGPNIQGPDIEALRKQFLEIHFEMEGRKTAGFTR